MTSFEIPAILASPTFWFVAGGAVVAVAALLLIAIWWVARGIEEEAVRALAAAERIRDHTAPIWRLADTVDVLEEVHRRVRSIAEKAETLAAAVHGEGGGGGHRGPDHPAERGDHPATRSSAPPRRGREEEPA